MLEIFIDGASIGNPGPAGIGIIICKDGQVIKNFFQYIGKTTNNIAEYIALIYGLQEALILRQDRVKINTDSQLLAQQINGKYKVKSENLKPFFQQVQHLLSGFKNVQIINIPRNQNKGADKLANKAIREQAKMVVPHHFYSSSSATR